MKLVTQLCHWATSPSPRDTLQGPINRGADLFAADQVFHKVLSQGLLPSCLASATNTRGCTAMTGWVKSSCAAEALLRCTLRAVRTSTTRLTCTAQGLPCRRLCQSQLTLRNWGRWCSAYLGLPVSPQLNITLTHPVQLRGWSASC